MAVVIPIDLNQVATSITQVLSLFDAVPAFQNSFYADDFSPVDPINLQRDDRIPSYGFPHSANIDPVAGPFLDINGKPLPYYPLPRNSYAINIPSRVYNNDALPNSYSVLLIDATVTPLEPGIKRLRVDYINSRGYNITEYVDVPFWQQYDHHPTDTQDLIDYSEESNQFIQNQIDELNHRVRNVLATEQLRGLTVSGQIHSARATDMLAPSAPSVAHNLPTFLDAKSVPLITEKDAKLTEVTTKLFAKDIAGGFSILSASPASGAYPGEFVTLTTSQPLKGNEQVFFSQYRLPLKATITANTIKAVLPSNVRAGAHNMFIANAVGAPLTTPIPYSITAFPVISSIENDDSQSAFAPGDQLTINGNNFGATIGSVTFAPGLSATIVSWYNNQVIVVVPSGAQTGLFTFKTAKQFELRYSINILTPTQMEEANFALSPLAITASPGTTTQFTTSLYGSPLTTNVDWGILANNTHIGHGDNTYGYIDTNGFYTAPASITGNLNLVIAANYHGLYKSSNQTASIVLGTASASGVLAPQNPTIAINATAQFNLYNLATQAASAIWSVNQVVGGNDQYGRISSTGLYTAPGAIPPQYTINIQGQNGSTYATTAVRLVDPFVVAGKSIGKVLATKSISETPKDLPNESKGFNSPFYPGVTPLSRFYMLGSAPASGYPGATGTPDDGSNLVSYLNSHLGATYAHIEYLGNLPIIVVPSANVPSGSTLSYIQSGKVNSVAVTTSDLSFIYGTHGFNNGANGTDFVYQSHAPAAIFGNRTIQSGSPFAVDYYSVFAIPLSNGGTLRQGNSVTFNVRMCDYDNLGIICGIRKVGTPTIIPITTFKPTDINLYGWQPTASPYEFVKPARLQTFTAVMGTDFVAPDDVYEIVYITSMLLKGDVSDLNFTAQGGVNPPGGAPKVATNPLYFNLSQYHNYIGDPLSVGPGSSYSINPSLASLPASGTLQFNMVRSYQGVLTPVAANWRVDPGAGNISSTGLFTAAASGVYGVYATTTDASFGNAQALMSITPTQAPHSLPKGLNLGGAENTATRIGIGEPINDPGDGGVPPPPKPPPIRYTYSITPSNTTVEVGDGAQLQMIQTKNGAETVVLDNVTWSASPSGISIDQYGNVTSSTTGTYTITGAWTDTNSVTHNATAIVTYVPVPNYVYSLTPNHATISVGQSQQLTFASTPSRILIDVVYLVTGGQGSVDANGLFTPITAGTYTISATGVQPQMTATAVIQVNPKPGAPNPTYTYSIVPPVATAAINTNVNFNMVQSDGINQTIVNATWSVGGDNSVTQSGMGCVVHTYGAGTNLVTGTLVGSGETQSAILTVQDTAPPAAPTTTYSITPSTSTLAATQSVNYALIATVNGASNPVPALWSTNGGGGIDGKGNFTASTNGTWTITASPIGGTGSATATVTVAGSVPTTPGTTTTPPTPPSNFANIYPSDAALPIGGTELFVFQQTLNGTTTTAPATWTVSGGGTIDSNGNFNATNFGAYTITGVLQSNSAITATARVSVTSIQTPPPKNLPQYRPQIYSIAPVQAYIGDQIAIYGNNLNTTTTVYFDSVQNSAYPLGGDGNNTINVVVPPLPIGSHNLYVDGPTGTSGTVAFQVLPGMQFNAISPSSGSPNTQVTINGSGFGSFVSGNTVTFDNIPAILADPSNWTDTQISVITPSHSPGAVPAKVTLANGHTATSSWTFSAPIAYTVSPASNSIEAGETVQLTAFANGSPVTSTWSISDSNGNNLNGGDAAHGFINQSGFYTAPTSITGNFYVVANATSSGSSSSAFINVFITPRLTTTRMELSPSGSSVQVPNGMLQFNAFYTSLPNLFLNPGFTTAGTNWTLGSTPASGLFDSVNNRAIIQYANGPVQPVTISQSVNVSNFAGEQVSFGVEIQVPTLSNSSLTLQLSALRQDGTSLGVIGTSTPITSTQARTHATVAATLPSNAYYVVGSFVATQSSSTNSLTAYFSYPTLTVAASVTGDKIAPQTWYVNDIAGGNAVFGFINSQGLYQAPDTITYLANLSPDSAVQAPGTWVLSGTPAMTPYTTTTPSVTGWSIVGTGDILNSSVHGPSFGVTPGETVVLSGAIDATNVVSGNPIWALYDFTSGSLGSQLFTAAQSPGTYTTVTTAPFIIPNGVTSVVSLASTNGAIVTNGQTLRFSRPQVQAGTKASPYVVPGMLGTNFTNVTIAATYTPPKGNLSASLTSYASVALVPAPITSPTCQINVLSQININFGDGRHGYIPSGTQFALTPGYYLIATYKESLDKFLRPLNMGSQQLSLIQHNAKSGDVADFIYNNGTTANESLIRIGNNTLQSPYIRPYSVVIGICDPVDGRFHSMWDIETVYTPIYLPFTPAHSVYGFAPSDFYSSIGAQSLSADQIATTTGGSTTLQSVAGNVTAVTAPDLSTNHARTNSMWTGNASFNPNTGHLSFTSNLQLISFNVSDNIYDVEYVTTPADIIVPAGNALVAEWDGTTYHIDVLQLNQMVLHDPKNYVLGVSLDRFYSNYPFLQVSNMAYNTSVTNIEGTNVVQLGASILQWGTLTAIQTMPNSVHSFHVTFPQSFSRSYDVKCYIKNNAGGDDYINVKNKALSGFDASLTNQTIGVDFGEIAWFAIGV